MEKVVAIDIGSHTARMLIAEVAENSLCFQPLIRVREYIRLADGCAAEEGWPLGSKAMNRTAEVLENFRTKIDHYQADHISVVATGVVRQARNQLDLLEAIYRSTGLRARVISGEEEARLTELGVSSSLPFYEGNAVIFDLGGGSTEVIGRRGQERDIRSLPLGAMVLTRHFFTADPPSEPMIQELFKAIDRILAQGLSFKREDERAMVIGTGGTATTLAAITRQVETRDICHENVDQTILNRQQVVLIFEELKKMKTAERSRIVGLDKGRADVILAGTMAVIKILDFFDSQALVVSLSDILEGLIIDHLKEN